MTAFFCICQYIRITNSQKLCFLHGCFLMSRVCAYSRFHKTEESFFYREGLFFGGRVSAGTTASYFPQVRGHRLKARTSNALSSYLTAKKRDFITYFFGCRDLHVCGNYSNKNELPR